MSIEHEGQGLYCDVIRVLLVLKNKREASGEPWQQGRAAGWQGRQKGVKREGDSNGELPRMRRLPGRSQHW